MELYVETRIPLTGETDMLIETFLTESSGGSSLQKKLRLSPLTSKFGMATVVETGTRVTNRGKLHFAKTLFRKKGSKQVDAVEFLSVDDTFQEIAGFVLYKDLAPERTLLYKKDAKYYEVSLEEVTEGLASAGKLTESMLVISSIVSLLLAVVTLAFTGKWVFESIKANVAEQSATTDAEERLNSFLFSSQTGGESAFDAYSEVVAHLKSLIEGRGRGLILHGMSGTGKSFAVRRTLHFSGLQPGKDYIIVKGSSASVSDNIRIVYSTLYNHNGKLIIFDDFDSALADANTVNLLKAALDSYPVRIVAMPDRSSYSTSHEPLPARFEFTGRIVMITNLDKIDPALMSRAQTVRLDFSTDDFEKNIGKTLKYINPEVPMATKKEVYEFLCDSIAQNPKVTLDFRRFAAMVDMRVAYPTDWKVLCHGIIYPETRS